MLSKIIEALALATPVLTTPVGAQGIAGLVHGENCFIFSEKNIQAWCDTVFRLANDQKLRDAIGARGRALVAERYSAHAAGAQWIELFNTVVSRSSD
jgi:glycosyltransferase involved in cell wall biosynthesis